MAKQRRAHPRATARKTESRARSQAAPTYRASSPPAEKPPPRRSTYVEAVGHYERGLELLQRHEFPAAAEAFRTVLDRYPEERELHDRVRLYLRVCARETEPPPPPPQTVEERVYRATVAINAGTLDEALEQLRLAHAQEPENDHVLYMLAMVSALRRRADETVAYLRRAVELNPENRALARQESDFDAVREYEPFRQLLDTPAPSRRRNRGRLH